MAFTKVSRYHATQNMHARATPARLASGGYQSETMRSLTQK